MRGLRWVDWRKYWDRNLKHKDIIVVGVVLVTALLVYGNIWGNQFVWDDNYFIFNWPEIRAPLSHIEELLRGDVPLGQGSTYRPVRSWFYALSYQMWGIQPWGYHLQSILILFGTAVCLYFILLELTESRLTALTGGLIFAVHPINVEAITWVTASFDSLGKMIGLWSLYGYLRAKHQINSLAYRYSVGAFLVAGFAVELTLILPLWLWWIDLLKSKKIRWSIYKPYGVVVVAYAGVRQLMLGLSNPLPSLFSNFSTQVLVMIKLVSAYVKVFFWPTGLTVNHQLGEGLSNFYRADVDRVLVMKVGDVQLFEWGVFILIVLVGIYLWMRRRNYPAMAFLFFAGMTSLLPVIHIFPIYGYFYETYAYLMAAFFAGLVAIGMRNLINFFRNWGGEKMGIIAAVAPILVILILAKLTWKQNMVWANPIQLWVNAYQFTPESAKVNNNLGLAYVRNNQIREAIPYLEASVRLTPQNSAYQESLAYAYLETGQQALVVTQLNAFLTTTDAVRACGAIERLFSEYHVEELFAKLTDCNNK